MWYCWCLSWYWDDDHSPYTITVFKIKNAIMYTGRTIMKPCHTRTAYATQHTSVHMYIHVHKIWWIIFSISPLRQFILFFIFIFSMNYLHRKECVSSNSYIFESTGSILIRAQCTCSTWWQKMTLSSIAAETPSISGTWREHNNEQEKHKEVQMKKRGEGKSSQQRMVERKGRRSLE